MELTILTTDRLEMRLVNQAVLEYVHQNYSDQELMTFIGLKDDETLRKEKQKFADGLFTHNKSLLYFQLFEKGKKEIIGTCGYHTWYADHDRAEVFYLFHNAQYQNKGYMREAMEFVLEYGFETMNLNRIEAFIGKDNQPSLKLIKRFNFEEEGLLKKHYLVNDEYQDSLVFGLVRSI